jgi:hypothetical protein
MGARSLSDEAALGAARDLSEGDRRLDGTLDPATLARTRAELANVAKEFFADVATRNRLRAETAHVDAKGKVRRGPAPPTRQLLMALAPGIGKTTALATALAPAPIPAVALTPLTTSSADWQRRLEEGGRAHAGHAPRHTPTKREIKATTPTTAPAGVCWRMRNVETAGAANHVPSWSICHGCPEGLRAGWYEAKGDNASAEAHARIEMAVAAHPLMPHPLDPDTLPCGYTPAQRREAGESVVVATAAAFTPSMLTRPTPLDRRRRADAVLIIDEPADLIRRIAITARAVSDQMEALGLARIVVARDREREDSARLARCAQVLDEIHPHLSRLHRMLVDDRLERSVVEEIGAALGPAARAAPTGTSISAGLWETVRVRWERGTGGGVESTVQAVLRFALDLAWAAQFGAMRLVPASAAADGTATPARIEISAPTSLGQVVIAGSAPTIIADATPSRSLRAIVAAHGDTVVTLRPPLPVRVTRDSSRTRGRGRGGRDDGRRIEREAWAVVVAAEKMRLRRGVRPIIITHRPWAKLIIKNKWWPADTTGWWGADERAHDRWARRDLVIAGTPTLPPDAAERAYLAERGMALDAGAPPADWPDWTPDRVESDGRMVPALPAISEWDEDRVGNALTQAIGRCRPLDHPGCEVLLLGPRIDLIEYGITVVELATASAGDASERSEVAHLARLRDWAEAGERLEDRGEEITRDALRAEGASGGNRVYTELRPMLAAAGTARALATRLRAELDAARAASGLRVEVARSRPDASGRTRTLVRVVPDEAWLTANTRQVVRLLERPPARIEPVSAGSTGQRTPRSARAP